MVTASFQNIPLLINNLMLYDAAQGIYQCPGTEEMLPVIALCNGTAECPNGQDETNALCAGEIYALYLYKFGGVGRTLEAEAPTV